MTGISPDGRKKPIILWKASGLKKKIKVKVENSDEKFMRQAILQAREAYENNEIPVGVVIISSNRIIAKAYNQVECLVDATAHAEMIGITAAFNTLSSKYLDECTMYVTLEPCVMCAGALYWAQLKRLVYAAPDPEKGFTNYGSQILHPKTTVTQGIMAQESGELLDDFFRSLRN